MNLLEQAQVRLSIDTADPPTQRTTFISIGLHGIVTLSASGHTYTAKASNKLWHNRQPNQALQPIDAPSARG